MTTTKETRDNATSKSPSHIAYHVRDIEGGKGLWTLVGSAWPHRDGKGFNIQVHSVPLDGRITLRVMSDEQK